MLGVAVAMLLIGLGTSAAVSARWVYPVPKPGESPLKTPQGSTGASLVAQGVGMGISLALALPPVALGIAAGVLGSALLGWLALLVGIGIGVAALIFGVRWGGRQLDQHAPELLQKTLSWA